MRDRNWISLLVIVLLALLALYIALPIEHPTWLAKALFWQPSDLRSLELKLGLDLQGGLQVLLEADVPAGETVTTDAMDAVRTIIEQRVNGLGVTEPVVQIQGDRRIIVELPGVDKPEQAIATLKGTGLLEFVEAGAQPVSRGYRIITDFAGGSGSSVPVTATEGITPTVALTETQPVTVTSPLSATQDITVTDAVTATEAITQSIAEATPTPTKNAAPAAAQPVTKTVAVTETAVVTNTQPVTQSAALTTTGTVTSTAATTATQATAATTSAFGSSGPPLDP
jgi:preprotein translocase subunit SecD